MVEIHSRRLIPLRQPFGLLPTKRRSAESRYALIRALYEREWARRQQELGRVEEASGRWTDGADRLPRVDAKTQAAYLAYGTDVLAQLDKIPAGQLSPDEKVNAAVCRRSVQTLADGVRFKTYEAPFNADTFRHRSKRR